MLKIFQAKQILTMDKAQPTATHIAVEKGHIIAVGNYDIVSRYPSAQLDTQFSEKTLLPGFVEGHAHLMAGAMWEYTYTGYHDRIDPDGVLWNGMHSIEDVVSRLKTATRNLGEKQPLIGWGFDPIFLKQERLSRHHLDQISATRPIAIIYSNFHVMCVNSAALDLVDYDQETDVEGVLKDDHGGPTGELQELAAMFPVMRRLDIDIASLSHKENSIRSYAKVAHRAGVTTIADLFASMTDDALDSLLRVTGETSYPVRIVSALGALGATPVDIANRVKRLSQRSTDKLRLGSVKLMTDGSIQGWTARLRSPGYSGGQPNGIWNMSPDEIRLVCDIMHQSGVQMHIHVNGDEAAEITIDALEKAVIRHGKNNCRHVLQHCQMMDADMFARCAKISVSANIFANHIWYFGDQHAALTIGDERAERMDACRTAIDNGAKIAIHSDAPVTPLAPLFTAWCAVNRKTMSGRTLGHSETITIQEALEAITIGAAYTLNLEDEIGSITVGKKADFVILDADPMNIKALQIKDINVLGTVFGGEVHLL